MFFLDIYTAILQEHTEWLKYGCKGEYPNKNPHEEVCKFPYFTFQKYFLCCLCWQCYKSCEKNIFSGAATTRVALKFEKNETFALKHPVGILFAENVWEKQTVKSRHKKTLQNFHSLKTKYSSATSKRVHQSPAKELEMKRLCTLHPLILLSSPVAG